MDTVETNQSLNPGKETNIQFDSIEKDNKHFKQSSDQKEIIEDDNMNGTQFNLIISKAKLQISENLNKQIPKDTISTTSNEINSNNIQQDKNSINAKNGFFSKTKQWAGNMWNSLKNIQFKKMFAKPEFKEYRNANGDIVRIPVKKTPLKKKEEFSENVKKKIADEKNMNINVNNYDNAARGMFIFY